MRKCLPLFVALSLLAPCGAYAQGPDVLITIGDQVDPATPIVINLAPDTLTTIPVYIEPAGAGPGPNIEVLSARVVLWISDPAEVDPGNPNPLAYPNILPLDLVSGIFAGAEVGLPPFDGTRMYEAHNVLAPPGAGGVAPSGLLMKVTIDTTGISDGDFIMALDWPGSPSYPDGDPTTLSAPGGGDISADMGRVTLHIPEPVSMSLLAVGGVGVLLRRRRR